MSGIVSGILVTGLLNGSIYALLAIGFSLSFGVAKILNLAHTGFYMVAAFIVFAAAEILLLNVLVSSIFAVVGAGILGGVTYKLLLDRVKVHETAVMIVSIALVLLFEELLFIGFGALPRGLASFVIGTVKIAGISVPYQRLFVIGLALATLGVTWVVLSKTNLGIAIRAVAEDREVANLMGINVGQISLIVVSISAALAGVAAIAAAPLGGIEPLMWVHPLIMVLAAVILGGLGSIHGSIIGAFLLALLEAIVVFTVPQGSFLRGAVALGILVLVLMIKPEGLFGKVFEEERL